LAGAASVAENLEASGYPNQFMELSSLLIAHRLDRDVGFRLAAALGMKGIRTIWLH
jgi:hypothetical protein